jgi:iron complex transport system ATP-binding protein
VPRHEARIVIFGEERWNVWDVQKRIGMVSHDLQHDYVTCAEGLKIVLSGFYASNDTYDYRSFTPAQIDWANEVMQELGGAALATRRFGRLSTGEQRRLLLGRAPAHDLPVLVLDEPTSGLDVKACFQYLDLLRAQIRRGKTVLLVTHHLHAIPPEIDRVILVKDGRTLADGAKSAMMTGDQISDLFDRRIVLARANGWHQALPG